MNSFVFYVCVNNLERIGHRIGNLPADRHDFRNAFSQLFCDLCPGSNTFFDQQDYNYVTKGGRLDIGFVKIGQGFPDILYLISSPYKANPMPFST